MESDYILLPRLFLRMCLAFGVGAVVPACAPSGENAGPRGDGSANSRAAAAAFESLAGAPVRLVWIEGERLMAFDSTQAGSPQVVREGARIERPLMSPDGEGVIFTEDGRIHTIGWTAREDRALTDGFAVAVLRDPDAGPTWVYATPSAAGEAIFRFLIEDPTRRELIWDKGAVDPRSIQFSRDGHIFSAVFFGRDFGLAEVGTGLWRKRLTQDNSLLAPDNSYISAVLDGTRRRMRFFLPNGDPHDAAALQTDPPVTWQLELSSHHALGDRDVSGLRWLNRPRFLTAALEDGESSRIGIARLSPNLRQIEDASFLRVSSRGLRQPDGWIGNAADEVLDQFPQAPSIEKEITQFEDGRWLRWPRTYEGVRFLWANDYSNNQIPGRTEPCRVAPQGTGRFDRWGSMRLDGGTFESDIESARAFTAAAVLDNRFSVELALSESIDKREPFSARLVALQLDENRDAFSLSRVDQALVLRVLLEPGDGSAPPREYQASLAPVSIMNNRVSHVRVSVDAGKVSWALDGETMPGEGDIGPPSLRAWAPQQVKRLVIGDAEPHGGAGWKARIDHVLLRTSKITWEEIRDNVANALRDASERLHPRPLRIRARLREGAPAPFPAAAPSRVLVQQVYDVVDVVSGSYDRPNISVIHWAMLGAEPVPSRPTAFARTYEMLLGVTADHPELESEPVRLGPRGFHLPLYFDVSPLDAPPATPDEKK